MNPFFLGCLREVPEGADSMVILSGLSVLIFASI